jgi:hypothetical protein
VILDTRFWNGRDWRSELVRIPAGVNPVEWSLLKGVSCPTEARCYAVGQTACVAVGASNWQDGTAAQEQDLYYAYQNVSGVNQWAGTTTAGTYNGTALNAVDCASGYQCIAVGQATAGMSKSD